MWNQNFKKVFMNTDDLLTEKSFTQFTLKSSWSVICCYKKHIHISTQSVKALNVMARLLGRTSRTYVRPNEVTLKHQTEEKK